MTKRITHIAKPLLPATLTLSALMSMTACASSAAKPSAASSSATTATAVSAPSAAQQSPASGASSAADGSTQSSARPLAPVSSKSGTKASAPKTTAPTGGGLAGACSTDHLKGTVSGLTRPINHILLTVTNTGSTVCSLYYFPALRLDADQQSVTQAVEDSKPQAVVTIDPGQSAYAAIGTSAADGSGGTPQLEKQVQVFLETRDQNGSLPGSMTLPLPAGTYVDIDKAFVTYWEADLQSAIAW